MRSPISAVLMAMALVACGDEASRETEVEVEATAVGTVVSDSVPAALYRLQTTYDGPSPLMSVNRVTFDITREPGASTVTARVEVSLLVDGAKITGANATLDPADTEPSLVVLAWTGWCTEATCDATADLRIDLTPAGSDANPAVTIDTIAVSAQVTHETTSDRNGIVQAMLTPVMILP